jgi:hypothetical protein
MMRDIVSRLAETQVIGPAVLTADNTPAALDLAGFNSAAILISVGAGGITFTTSNKIEFVVTHSDDDTTYTNVTDADMLGVTSITNGIVRSLTAAKAAADTAPTELGYIGGKRYLKVLADFSGTHATGTPISVVLVKGNGVYKPS